MASRGHRGGLLDATSDRSVVYCHACTNQWYRDGHDLRCPACGSDITEIVELNTDPRAPHNYHSPPSATPVHYEYDDGSDPDVADIDEFTGPHGFIHRRSIRTGRDEAGHHDPGVEPVLHRFYEMLQTFSPIRATPGQENPPERGEPGSPPWPRIQRTTFTSGPFGSGTASVTIFTGSPPARQQGAENPHNGTSPDPYQTVLSQALRDLTVPQGQNPAAQLHQATRSLQEFLSLFNPANAMSGDAVYSQEALDRIITQLMDTNPQSNAAPPASAEALRTLERKSVDREMLRGESKTECTICIEDMTIGDQAVVLPCKHWFHEDCVVLWLKEHNTCPICRTPIEADNANNSHNQGGGDHATRTTSRTESGTDGPGLPPRPSRGLRGHGDASERSGPPAANASGGHAAEYAEGYRPLRLEAFRASYLGSQERGDRAQGRETPMRPVFHHGSRQWSSSSRESPDSTATGDRGAQVPRRSSSGNGRGGQGGDGASGRPTSQGPFSWLRERFTGGGSYSGNAPRGERRYH
ncbi:hypothetical protein CDD80_6627 [Ophiocordyceps camponoti-rufipedis]|uniref:RING-type E3 ubiquitin transferase n=1 Tax=Ophiocordyceps camponoti-rufipedis TaxID=2004952 RepID=A0A2C5Z9N9_9HYPO|nr:hypothetical protein CDD80_6627 [Ophiocordyceps camponoti-rufipedis]